MNTRTRPVFFCLLAVSLLVLTGADAAYKVEPVKKAPDGLSETVTKALDPSGYRVSGPDGTICEIWLAKTLLVQPGFKPTLNVKYPFNDGQLIGAVRVPQKPQFTDFRGQEIAAGVYTLRYGKQPQDGNHIGTSLTYDFLLALPAKIDKDPLEIRFTGQLHERSAESVDSTHPAIFSLLPAEDGAEPHPSPSLSHDEDEDFRILNITGRGKAEGEEVKVPLRLVVVGESLE